MAEKRLIDADELLIAFDNALNNANLKIGYGFMEWVVNKQPTMTRKACDRPQNGLSFGSWRTAQSASAETAAATKHLHHSTGTQTMSTAANADTRWRD